MYKAVCALFLFLLPFNVVSQVYTSDRKIFINTVLSDTVIGEDNYYIALKMKSKKSDTVKVYIDWNSSLYSYLKKNMKWSWRKYAMEMNRYLTSDKIFVVDDNEYFNLDNCPPLSACKSQFSNISTDSLIYLFKHRKRGEKVHCFVYTLFNRKVLIGQGEYMQVVRPLDEQKMFLPNGIKRKNFVD